VHQLELVTKTVRCSSRIYAPAQLRPEQRQDDGQSSNARQFCLFAPDTRLVIRSNPVWHTMLIVPLTPANRHAPSEVKVRFFFAPDYARTNPLSQVHFRSSALPLEGSNESRCCPG